MEQLGQRHKSADRKQGGPQGQREHAKTRQGASPQGEKTRSYKHVSIEHKRPSLTKEGNAGQRQANSSRGRKRTFDSSKKDKGATLKIIPLGGLDAIGMNMTAFECKGDMILDDAGLMFPDDNHPGVDLILPDYTYVLEHARKLKGIVITHGHEDHTGSLPYLYKDLDVPVPIYGTKMTLGLIEGKFAEHKIKNARLVEIKPGDTVKLGCFTAEFFAVNHSIPGSVGVFFRCPAGNVLHTGDFKLDQTPIDGVTTDFGALARFSTEGVDLMMSDSTNAMNPNFTLSEAEVGKELSKIIAQARGRVIIASFASHIHRMQQICDAAVASGRKVVVTGRSMIQNTDIARRLGYLNISDDDLIDAYELKDIPSDQVVIMCTGSQGEPLSALARIANGEHKTIDIEEGDTVIISATPVPGNEKAVTRVVNQLAKIGADVWDKSRGRVHVSGHAGAEELKLVLSIVQPKAFMPVHGEASHLRAHARLAEATGVPVENIFVCENGESLELSAGGIERGETVQSGIVFVDGLSVGDTSMAVLEERSALSSQGVVSIAAALNLKKRTLLGDPAIEMHGVSGGDDGYLLDDATTRVRNALLRTLDKGCGAKELKKAARDSVHSLLWERTKTRPMVVVSLLEV
ncbi:ribonuclease J [Xiamenia xianingshaonis]|uniref:Ribonuclease J n=1 Tax=Xiamenia xianingshaonis TaxID=2682776 RepID=A0A9E6MRW5_9ACTN|nr:ribonuclease J [Xiamenia xianingshaonis]NHM13695.1 RNase J family beta-CASP ribonuclease [Xiamenia xianingshaonis]QTU85065.1 ribonuclease J [Xiamenia xianingshaonis]